MTKEVISKRISLDKEVYKKIKITANVLEIDKKENEMISEVVNKAVEFYFREKVLLEINRGLEEA